MSEEFECPFCCQSFGHAYGCPNEALEMIGEYDPYSVSRPTKRAAKKKASKSRKSTVKKVSSRPAQRSVQRGDEALSDASFLQTYGRTREQIAKAQRDGLRSCQGN